MLLLSSNIVSKMTKVSVFLLNVVPSLYCKDVGPGWK